MGLGLAALNSSGVNGGGGNLTADRNSLPAGQLACWNSLCGSEGRGGSVLVYYHGGQCETSVHQVAVFHEKHGTAVLCSDVSTTLETQTISVDYFPEHQL